MGRTVCAHIHVQRSTIDIVKPPEEDAEESDQTMIVSMIFGWQMRKIFNKYVKMNSGINERACALQ